MLQASITQTAIWWLWWWDLGLTQWCITFCVVSKNLWSAKAYECKKMNVVSCCFVMQKKIFWCLLRKYLLWQDSNPVKESQISLDDFNIIKVIGRGSYAKVLMVRCCASNRHYKVLTSYRQVELKQTKRVYAMKVIKKDLVLDEEVGYIKCHCCGAENLMLWFLTRYVYRYPSIF